MMKLLLILGAVLAGAGVLALCAAGILMAPYMGFIHFAAWLWSVIVVLFLFMFFMYRLG